MKVLGDYFNSWIIISKPEDYIELVELIPNNMVFIIQLSNGRVFPGHKTHGIAAVEGGFDLEWEWSKLACKVAIIYPRGEVDLEETKDTLKLLRERLQKDDISKT